MAEIYNIVDANRRAVQSGLALGAQMASNHLRMQQLKSEQALQQMRERQAAETLKRAMIENDMLIAEQAHNAQASARFQMMTTPTLQMPIDGPPTVDGGGLGTAPVPNPAFIPDAGEAFLKAYLPGSQDPAKVILNAATLQMRQAQTLAEERQGKLATHEPRIMNLTNEATGKPVSMVEGRPGSWERVPESSLNRQLTVEQTKQLLAKNPDLLKFDPSVGGLIPDWSRADEIQRALKVGAGITSGTRTDVEKRLVDTDEAIARASNALQVITQNPDAIGLVGAGRSGLERAAGQLGIPTDARIAKARNQLGQDFVGLAQGLRLDSGNMSYYERKKLEGIGDPTQWEESAQTAKDMMANIQAALLGKKLRQLKTLNRPIDQATLNQIPFEELPGLYDSDLIEDDALLALVQARRITPDQAREIKAKKAKG